MCDNFAQNNVSAIVFMTNNELFGRSTASSQYFLQLTAFLGIPVITWAADNAGLEIQVIILTPTFITITNFVRVWSHYFSFILFFPSLMKAFRFIWLQVLTIKLKPCWPYSRDTNGSNFPFSRAILQGTKTSSNQFGIKYCRQEIREFILLNIVILQS